MTTKLEQNEAATKRWRTRLKRAMTMLDKLERQRKRLEKAAAGRASLPAYPTVHSEATLGTLPPPVEPPIDTGIPAFLQRKLDPVAEQIATEQQATKTAKARGRIAKMKAKQSGETRRMPLTGKAALQAIRG
jgi:hypothetical protein